MSPEPIPLVLYTRRDCHLCEAMKAEMARARIGDPYSLEEVDIDGDEELVRAHGRSIPVLEIGGRTAFKGRLTATDFERRFARLAADYRSARAGKGET